MIVGVLSTALIASVSASSSRVITARAKISQLESALEFYRLDMGDYPASEQGLSALLTRPPDLANPERYPKGGYMKKSESLIDPWGEPFHYLRPGVHNPEHFDLWSTGADQTPGGVCDDADVGNWPYQSGSPTECPGDHWAAIPAIACLAAGGLVSALVGIPIVLARSIQAARGRRSWGSVVSVRILVLLCGFALVIAIALSVALSFSMS